MRYFTADIIYPGNGERLMKHVLITEDDGRVVDLKPMDDISADVEILNGALIPGFINTHCHLELSHMKSKIPTGTGLIDFISAVVKFREFPQELIDKAIREADAEMYANGIVAVGDICNKLDTAACKSLSPIAYYSFVEMFDFHQPNLLQPTIDQYAEVLVGQSDVGENEKNLVPHAPYSCSPALFEYIRNAQKNPQITVSIHNQETPDENLMFTEGSGAFYDFYRGFGFNLDGFEPISKTAIHFNMKYMNPQNRNLFVHNTLTSENDIMAAHQWSDHVYWATCANANLYIENKLPDYSAFINQDANMTIGTDSLSSNWQLSILSEIQTIKKYNSYIDTALLLKWATKNGAEALGYGETLGSFEKAKKPGILHLEGQIEGDDIDLLKASVRRIL